MVQFLKYQRLTLLWALFVLIMCSISMSAIDKHTSSFTFTGFDKLVHCGFLYMFTALLCNGIIRQRHNLTALNTVIAIITGVAFGGAIELLQLYLFTWRTADWADLFADSVGVGMGAFCTLLILAAARHEKT